MLDSSPKDPLRFAIEAAVEVEKKSFDGTKYGTDASEIPVLVHKVKGIEHKDKACVVYFHGGGACLLDAAFLAPYCSRLAFEGNIIVVNVDYRLAPEAPAPKGIRDCYAAFKWVYENAEELGVDQKRIAIMGESGGGYLCLGAAIEAAKRGDADKIKLMIPQIPMTSSLWHTLPAEKWPMHLQSRVRLYDNIDLNNILAGDRKSKDCIDDPYIYPNNMGDELLSQMPNAVVMTSEWDILRIDAYEIAHLLKEKGKLLDFCDHPRSTHGFYGNHDNAMANTYYKDMARLFEKYLIN